MSGDKHWDVKMHEYNRPDPAHDELVKRDGKIHPSARTGSVIVAAIRTASLTPHEEGEILKAIASRISLDLQEPEFEEVGTDLSDVCGAWDEAMHEYDERMAARSG